ncbi:hypothetical protein DL93DRAFT_2112449, partial [Clavulina sp. PMI_390]
MISIGGVIGTGVFLGVSQSLYTGGPLGLLLGYSIVGTVVYAGIISVSEIVAWLPRVGGIVRLAGLYVDPAFGFAMGWNCWYNWAITLPAEISAATVLMNDYFDPKWNWLFTLAMLSVAVGINCFGARLYGRLEFWFAMLRVLSAFIVIVSAYLDTVRAPQTGRIGFRYWIEPGPFAQFKGVQGNIGQFLGFWTVLIQACYSFFGVEVPDVAGGEVINASKNIPRAIRRIWIRILLFYVLAVFAAGLLVPHNACELYPAGNAPCIPFIIALRKVGWVGLSHVVNGAFVASAWSAAASDVYISSRYMFFLARCGHVWPVCGRLFRHKKPSTDDPPWIKTPPPQGDSETYANDTMELGLVQPAVTTPNNTDI